MIAAINPYPAKSVVAASGLIHMPSIRYLGILPAITLLGGAILLLAVSSLVTRPLRTTVSSIGTVLISLTALGFSLWQWSDVTSHGPFTTAASAVVVDGFAVLISILVCCSMILTAFVGDGYLRRERIGGSEFHVLALISASDAILMAEANDLIVIFLGLEILSISLYVLAAFNHKSRASGEAALKYFLLGGFSSAIFVYGIALTYGATGTTNLIQIADFLGKNALLSNGILLAGIGLLVVGFAFKVAAVPFHMWTPDVYDGSPSPITGFMAAVAKAGAFAAMLRVLVSAFGLAQTDWQPIIYSLAVLSLVTGSVLALRQRNVKRMLAYSSINHAGFILLGVEAATARGASSALYYLFVYAFMVIGSFAVLSVLGREGDREHDIESYRGLSKRQPFLAFSLAVLLLAQAGVPFTTGLWAKLQVVLAAASASAAPLAVIAMITATIAAFFYLRVATLMYTTKASSSKRVGAIEDQGIGATKASLTEEQSIRTSSLWIGLDRNTMVAERLDAEILLEDEPYSPTNDKNEKVPVLTGAAIVLCVAFTIIFGIIPGPILELAHKATLLFIVR